MSQLCSILKNPAVLWKLDCLAQFDWPFLTHTYSFHWQRSVMPSGVERLWRWRGEQTVKRTNGLEGWSAIRRVLAGPTNRRRRRSWRRRRLTLCCVVGQNMFVVMLLGFMVGMHYIGTDTDEGECSCLRWWKLTRLCVSRNCYIPIKMCLGQSAVGFCACKVIRLFSVVFLVVSNVHKFDFGVVVN
jgi:hypothetical protein